MSIFSLILEDKRSQREGWLSQGFWALLVFRLSAGRARVKNRLLRFLWRIPNLLFLKFIEVVTGITLPENTRVGRRLCIEHPGGIVIHGCSVIGDDCRIRQGVTLGAKTHQRPLDAPILGNRVDVGAGAKILGAVRIGDDAVIGANAVVIRDVPSGAVAVGVPARILRGRGTPCIAPEASVPTGVLHAAVTAVENK
jgi:serine O-acetyltransferase